MGLKPPPQYCFFTGLPATNILTQEDCIDYFISFDDNTVVFKLRSNYDWTNCFLIKENTTLIKGEIYNLNWPIRNQTITEEVLKKLINSSDAPKTPKQKLDKLFLEVFKLQKSEGERFFVGDHLFNETFWSKLYFKNINECNFYLKTLAEYGLIEVELNSSGAVQYVTITFKGLNYQIEITESGDNSNNCFVAMSFGQNMTEIREAIKLAIIETGFQPILIDEIHIDSERTINDEIIASIKKSKFCISDFTEQKDGVYFEAGYALGRGLKVIYTCNEEWFKLTHFDTNHFPHIIYSDPITLKEKLKFKIEAWIK